MVISLCGLSPLGSGGSSITSDGCGIMVLLLSDVAVGSHTFREALWMLLVLELGVLLICDLDHQVTCVDHTHNQDG